MAEKVVGLAKDRIGHAERGDERDIRRQYAQRASPVEPRDVVAERCPFVGDQELRDQVSRLDEEHLDPDSREPEPRILVGAEVVIQEDEEEAEPS